MLRLGMKVVPRLVAWAAVFSLNVSITVVDWLFPFFDRKLPIKVRESKVWRYLMNDYEKKMPQFRALRDKYL